jgi:hypothetical protein
VSLLVPNKLWRADTVVCDVEGTEWFVLMECEQSMRSYEAIFGDMYGHKLVCVRRKMMRQVWNDGFYICTYRPNFPNQPALYERDCNNSELVLCTGTEMVQLRLDSAALIRTVTRVCTG